MSASVPSAAPSRRGHLSRHLLRGVFATLAVVLALGGAAVTAGAEPRVVASADGDDSFIWG